MFSINIIVWSPGTAQDCLVVDGLKIMLSPYSINCDSVV